MALIENRVGETEDRWKLVGFHTSAGTGAVPTATVQLQREGDEVRCDAAIGDGPVDAVFRALERVTGVTARLEDYQVRSVSSGKDALGEVSVEITSGGRICHGKGVSTDIIEASARAYLKALNKVASDPAE
jgi:2-isopropylmalate synthase